MHHIKWYIRACNKDSSNYGEFHIDSHCSEVYREIIYTEFLPTGINNDIYVYRNIPYRKYGLSAVDIWSRSRLDLVLEIMSKCCVWSCLKYVLESKFQKPGLKLPKWSPI